MTTRPVLFSGNQEAVLGGEELQVSRLGDRFAVDIVTAQLQWDQPSRDLVASLTEATTGDAILELDVPGLPVAAHPAPVVDGDDQAGATIAVRGLAAASVLARGSYFSIVHSGRRYLHMLTAQAIVGGDGKASIPIWPMLRFLTIDGEACEFTQPYIEGKLTGFDQGATFAPMKVEPLRFAITERA